MKRHIGFYYKLYDNNRGGRELILGFLNNELRYYFIDWKKISWENRMLSQDHDISRPVIFSETEGQIDEVCFFSDIPNTNSSNKYHFRTDGERHSLCYDGKKVFAKNNYDLRETQFAELVVNKYFIKKELESFKQKSTRLSGDSFLYDGFLPLEWGKTIKELSDYIKGIDISSLLSSLYIKVWDSHISKVGGDDRYSVIKEVKLLDGTPINDDYLINLIGLGERTIHKESGYTSYFERPKIPFGVYEGETLEKEKQAIIHKYSSEKHMGWLIYSELSKQEFYKEEIIPPLENKLQTVKKQLNEDYYLERIASIDSGYFERMTSSNRTEMLAKINRLAHSIQSNVPRISIIITGESPKNDDYSVWKKIATLIEELSNSFNVIIITGRAKGSETQALYYAMDNVIEYIYDYHAWTMSGKEASIERARSMVKKADVLYYSGEPDYYITKNMIAAAKEKGILVKQL